MKIKAILFDTSVLIDLPINKMQKALKEIAEYYLPINELMSDYKQLFKKLQTGKIKNKDFFEELLKNLPARSRKRFIEQHWSERNKLVKLKKGVNEVLITLNDYSIGLISNMPKEWFMKDAKRLGLKISQFKTMIFSSETGTINKDFKQACINLGVKPSRCAYVTNDQEELINAHKTGLPVIMIRGEGDLRIESIKELIDLFSKTNEITKQVSEVDKPETNIKV